MIFLALVAAAALDLVPQVGHTVAAVDIATSPDGKVLVSAGANDGLRIWDPEHQRLVRSLPSELSGNILFVANDRLVSWAARASGGCNLDVLSLSKGEVVRVLRSDPSVMGCGAHELSASADGAIVAEGTWNGKAFVFDVTTGAELRRLESAEVGMGLSSLSPDGQKLAFAIYDKTEIQVVDVKSGGSAGALKSMGVRALGFTQSGVLVLEDKAIRTLDAGTGAELSKIVLEPGFKSGNFSRDGSLAAVSDSTAVRVFDLQTGQQVWSATQTELELQSSPSLVKTLMDVARGRAVLLPFLGDNSSMKLLDLKTGHVIGKFAGRVMAPLSSQLQPDGRHVVTRSISGLEVWDVATAKTTLRIPTPLAVSADATVALTAEEIAPGQTVARVYDLRTGVRRAEWKYAAHAGALSGDGGRAAIVWFDTSAPPLKHRVTVVDTRSGAVLREDVDKSPTAQVSDDGTWLALVPHSENGKVELGPASGTGFMLVAGQATGAVWTMGNRFSSDGKQFVTSGENGSRLFESASGKLLLDFPKGRSLILLDGSRQGLVTKIEGGYDLVELPSGRLVRSQSGERVINAATSRGKLLISTMRDTLVLELKSGKEIFRAPGYFVRGSDLSTEALLVTSGPAGVVISSIKEKRVLATRASGPTGDSIVYSPDGHFDLSSPSARDLVAWRLGDEVLGPDQFFEVAFTPGLIGQALGGKLPQGTVAAEFPPDVRLSLPPGDLKSESEIEVSVEAVDRGGGLSEVRLYHQGKLVERNGERGFVLKGGGRRTFKVVLLAGENLFRAVALSKSGIESAPAQASVTASGGVQPAADLWALVVGINEYEVADYRLRVARGDAEAIGQTLEERARPLFASVHVKRVFDREASRKGVLDGFHWLTQGARPQDVVVVFRVIADLSGSLERC